MVDRLLADAMRSRPPRRAVPGRPEPRAPEPGRQDRPVPDPLVRPRAASRSRAPLHFPQAVFWFEATFVSDQKEQELLPVAVDLHQGRQVRHLERLLDHAHLGESPWSPLPEARHGGLASAYPLARDRVVRTVAALANVRVRELGERLDRQIARMTRYYADLRAEMEEQAERARDPRRGHGQVGREARGPRSRGAPADRRASPEGDAEGPPATDQPAGGPPAQAADPGDHPRPRIGPDPPGTGLGPADRRAGGPPLPRMRPPDVRLRARPQGPPGLPLLRGLAPRAGQADAAMKAIEAQPAEGSWTETAPRAGRDLRRSSSIPSRALAAVIRLL